MFSFNVIKLHSPFERIKDFDFIPEVRLYKAIITQAIVDASNISENKQAKKCEIEAKKWLFGHSLDFTETCYRAEMHPNEVVKIAKNMILLKKKEKSINNKN